MYLDPGKSEPIRNATLQNHHPTRVKTPKPGARAGRTARDHHQQPVSQGVWNTPRTSDHVIVGLPTKRQISFLVNFDLNPFKKILSRFRMCVAWRSCADQPRGPPSAHHKRTVRHRSPATFSQHQRQPLEVLRRTKQTMRPEPNPDPATIPSTPAENNLSVARAITQCLGL